MKRLLLAIILVGLFCARASATKIPGWITLSSDYQGEGSELVISWDSIPGKSYSIMVTDELDGDWTELNPEPVVVPSQLGTYKDQTTSGIRFYRVRKLDTDPPEVVYLYPESNAIAVSREEALTIHLADETGIDSASIAFSVGSGPTVGVGDPRLSYSDGALTYTPDAGEFLGDYGETVTASLSVSDTLGHRLENYSWPLNLELEAIIAENVKIIDDTSPLTFLSAEDDTYTFSYTGDSPGTSVGDILASTDPENPYKIKVLTVTDDPGSHTVDFQADPVSLAELLEQGSVRMRHTIAEESPLAPLSAGTGSTPLNPAKIELDGITIYDDEHITVEITSGFIEFEPDCSVAADWGDGGLKSFDTEVTGKIKFKAIARATAKAAVTYEKKKNLKTIRKFFVQLVGWVPVWEEVVLEFNVGFTAEAEVEGWVEAGFESSKTITVGASLRDGEWRTYRRQKGDFTPIEPTWQVGGGVNLQVYVEPKLTVYLESLVGPSVNLKPYLEFDGKVQVNPPSYELALYAGLTSELAVEFRGWDDSWGELPSWTLLDLRKMLWHKSSASGSSEPGETSKQARLTPSDGKTQMHNFDTAMNETHWVRFDAEADMGYSMQVLNPPSATHGLELRLFDSAVDYITYKDTRAPFLDWVCPESGTYYLSLTPSSGETGTYELTILADDLNPTVDAFETDDEARLAKSIACDGTVQSRNFHIPPDVDWVNFYAKRDMGYHIEVLNVSSSLPSVYLFLCDAELNDVTSSSSRLSDWVCPKSGTYYLRADHSSTTGSYELRVLADEFNPATDDFETDDEAGLAKTIPCDGTVQSRNFHIVSDVDWAKFYAEKDMGYDIKGFNASSSLSRLTVFPCDAEFNRVAWNSGSSISPLFDWVCPASGTYYLQMKGNGKETGTYELTILADDVNPAVDTFETDDDASLAKTIPNDGTVQSRNFQTPDDVDWVKFDAEADMGYDIQVLNVSPDPSGHVYFDLYDADMEYIAPGTQRPPEMDWLCPASGTYYLKVRLIGGDTGSYELRVFADELNPDADAFETDDEARLAKTTATDGTVQNRTFHMRSDIDWVKFDAVKDASYEIKVFNLSPSLIHNAFFFLYDADMQYIDGGTSGHPEIDWLCPASGTYYLKVDSGWATGSYDLKVSAQ